MPCLKLYVKQTLTARKRVYSGSLVGDKPHTALHATASHIPLARNHTRQASAVCHARVLCAPIRHTAAVSLQQVHPTHTQRHIFVHSICMTGHAPSRHTVSSTACMHHCQCVVQCSLPPFQAAPHCMYTTPHGDVLLAVLLGVMMVDIEPLHPRELQSCPMHACRQAKLPNADLFIVSLL